MNIEILHEILVIGPDLARSRAYLERFFAKTPLVRYDEVLVEPERSCCAEAAEFWPRVEAGIKANRATLAALAAELGATGSRTLDDLLALDQGYPSKLLHTIAHLLDGFFGIDSSWYNLVEDSHWLSHKLQREIRQAPGEYWLLSARATLDLRAQRQLVGTLRRFEGND